MSKALSQMLGKMNMTQKNVGCGYEECKGVDFGPVPSFSYASWESLHARHDGRIDFELRLRVHDKVQRHLERRLVWKEVAA